MGILVKPFKSISINDLAVVGGKNASLGEMFNTLSTDGIKVPDGFATTAEAFWLFIDTNQLRNRLINLMQNLDRKEFSNLKRTGQLARALIQQAHVPQVLQDAVADAYTTLCNGKDAAVAVRSSATAEDLPNASFAGQHESFLNIKGKDEVIKSIRNCFASLYTDRAIKYREDNGFKHDKIALSAGVQLMVRSDKACSGIGFTLDPESGFRQVIHLSGVWGLGENIVQGAVIPDEFYLFKPTLVESKDAIIQKKLGTKEKTMIYADGDSSETTINIDTPAERRHIYVLNNNEVLTLGKWALTIENHYGRPMDIEWAKDGVSGELFIIQARPETVHSQLNPLHQIEYTLLDKATPIASGQAIGTKIATGIARILESPRDADRLLTGDIIVTDITSPDWDPLLKKSSAIITNKGGRTSHASIVARETGVPAVVGTGNGTSAIKDGELITVSCCEGKTGFIYNGKLKYLEKELDFSKVKMPESTEAMLIAADPDSAFKLSFYPNDGVGLMRMEFIITHHIAIHPMALARFDQVRSSEVKNKIEELTRHYPDKKRFFIEKLSQGIATIAAAFHPKDVIVRMSDFKTNEYANLIGGSDFEPKEENPMIGFRGASRYYNPLYQEGFEMECAAVRKVRVDMGLTNVKVMIPFCRTPEEGIKVIDVMKKCGLDRESDNTLEIYVMAEIPSNVLQADEFAAVFDGFSIGSNDLTQLTLGIDRDSSLVADLFSEKNKSVMELISEVINKARSAGVKIGLCGQAPSDLPEFAEFLVKNGIDSISFNPDSILRGIENIRKAENELLLKV